MGLFDGSPSWSFIRKDATLVPKFVPDSTELPESPQTDFALAGQIWLARAVLARLIIRRSLVRVQPAPKET